MEKNVFLKMSSTMVPIKLNIFRNNNSDLKLSRSKSIITVRNRQFCQKKSNH